MPRVGDTSGPTSQIAAREEFARTHGDGWRVPPEVTRAEPLWLGELQEDQRQWIAARFAA